MPIGFIYQFYKDISQPKKNDEKCPHPTKCLKNKENVINECKYNNNKSEIVDNYYNINIKKTISFYDRVNLIEKLVEDIDILNFVIN